MALADSEILPAQTPPPIHWGHFGVIALAAILLLGISYMKKPELFSFHKAPKVADDSNVPHYYAYVTPPEDQPQPAVLGASTNDGPQIIGDDGSVHSVDMSQVLGASTEGVQLSLADIKVNAVPESNEAAQKYFADSAAIESNTIGDANFASALNSGNQAQINQYAQKLITVRDALQKIPVPAGLVKLQQLKIIQYNSSIGLLQNFTRGDQNADLVTQNLQQFMKSQQDLDAENIVVAQKYGAIDPNSYLYLNPNGSPSASGALGAANDSLTGSGSLTNSNAGQ